MITFARREQLREQMHEFSIALSIVDLAEEYARKDNAREVKEVEVEVGELSGIVIDALEFALESAVKNTMLENAGIRILLVPGKARCRKCRHEYPAGELYAPCPECGSSFPDVIQGKDLRLKSLTVD
jgi:hydrogenase nickel incorporation protein HypA/HybF